MESRKKSRNGHMKLTLIFFLGICLATAINVVARKSSYSFSGLQNLMVFAMLAVLGLYGWLSVRRRNSGLVRNILMGLILSIGSHWSLPFFHKGSEIFQLLIVNSVIFAAVTFLGGLIAVLFSKGIETEKRNNDNMK